MRLLFLASALAASLLAQTPTIERRTKYPRVFALTELARRNPAEFAARGLLHLLDHNAIPDRDWRQEIAEEALRLAATAPHPLPRRLAPGLTAGDNSASLWNTAHRQELDSLSLSLRAIEQLRRLDRAVALAAFARLPRPAPASTTCRDALLDDVSAWYTMAARLGAPALPIVQTLRTDAEIAPAVDLIFQTARTGEQLDLLSGALGASLRNLPASDRGFAAALPQAAKALRQLHEALAARERPTAPLAAGWRAWMTANLSAPACQEARAPGTQQQAREEGFAIFNATLPPLDTELLKPTGEAVAAEVGAFTESESTRAQAVVFRELLFGGGSRALSALEKDTPEWREKLQKFLQTVEARTRGASESETEYFYRQSQLWISVIMAAPPGPLRDRAAQQFIAFLLGAAPHTDPMLWFSQLEGMATQTRSLHGADFGRVLTALRLSAHPALELYAELETDYPSRPESREY